MVNRCEAPYPLSKLRILLLLLNYFVGYQMLYPWMLREATMLLYPSAHYVPEWMQLLIYLWMILISIWLAYPLLQESYAGLLDHRKHLIKNILSLLGAYFLCSVTINLIIALISPTATSANQSQIISVFHIIPFVTFFSSVIYAPIVEEILFRGIFFRWFRAHMKFVPAALLSGLLFGFLHVMDSFFLGNFSDMIYLFSYGLIGVFFALAYEKTESIYGSMMLHVINNTVAFLMLTV